MRCYNCDRFGRKSQSFKSSRSQSLNKSFNSGRKTNKIWKMKGYNKYPKTKLERNGPKTIISHRKIWNRKYEGERKKDDLAPKNEEINNKKMMGEGPNKECEIQYEIDQAQEREIHIEEYDIVLMMS
jgi:hypothetical protein